MSWHYLQGEEAVSSEAICWDGEQFVPSRSTTTLGVYCWPDNVTESFRGSPSGTMSEHSTAVPGAVAAISSPADFPVPTSPWQNATQKVSTAPDPDYGRIWRESWRKSGLDSFSSKTLELWQDEDWILSSVTSRIRDLVGALRHFLRCLSAQTTREFGYGYLPTPTASDGNGGGHFGRKRKDWRLRDAVRNRFGKGPLHPELAELAMGFPIGWTDSAPLETDKFRQWLQSHSAFCQMD